MRVKRRGLQSPFSLRAEAQRRAWALHTWTTLPLVILVLLVVVIAVIVRGVEFVRGLFS